MKPYKASLITSGSLLFSLISLQTKAQLSIGLRTGVNYEIKQSGFYHTEKTEHALSWSQQLLANWNIGNHFLLEVNITHATFNTDIQNILYPPGIETAIRENSFNLNSIFSYKLLTAKSFDLYGGLGLGTYAYTNKSQFNLDAPSGIAAITAYYSINPKLKLTAQSFYSILLSSSSNAGVSNMVINVGATMRL